MRGDDLVPCGIFLLSSGGGVAFERGRESRLRGRTRAGPAMMRNGPRHFETPSIRLADGFQARRPLFPPSPSVRHRS